MSYKPVWIQDAWDLIPKVCPHGRAPEVSTMDSGLYPFGHRIPTTVDCPQECYDEHGVDKVLADIENLLTRKTS